MSIELQALKAEFFDEAEIMFSLWDENLICIDVNEAVVRFIKTPKSELIGSSITSVSRNFISSNRYRMFLNVLKTGVTQQIEEEVEISGLGKFYFRVKAFRINSSLGVVTKNITDLRMKINAQVEQLKMDRERLESQNRQLRDFCNIVSHNFRGPTVNMMMITDFIERAQSKEEILELTSKLRPVVTSLHDTLTELVESIQVQQDTDIEMNEVYFQSELHSVLITLDLQVAESGAHISADFTQAPKLIYPHKYIHSILTNLVSNALKYRKKEERCRIHLQTKVDGNDILLEVRDNGLGIDLERHGEHMFKIRRVFHDHPDAKGFGLYMTKTQVLSQGGSIWVESTPDVGTVFFIRFIHQIP